MAEKQKTALQMWKEKHREYYLAQKRRLAARPEYKAHRREMYKAKVDELKLLGILPRKRGRPLMYIGEEAKEMRRRKAREASVRYRARLISQRLNKDEYESSSPASETSNRSSSSGGSSADGPEERSRFSAQNPYWPISAAGG